MAMIITKGSRGHRLIHVITYSGLLVAVILLAAEAPDYRLISLSQVATLAVATLGLNFVTGYCGQISVGHGAFYGFGAYVTAILVTQYGWTFVETLPIVAAVGLVAGFVLGVPALRIRGLYLALVTMAVTIAFPAVARIDQLHRFTGGANGLPVFTLSAPPSWFPFAVTPQGWTFIELGVIAAVMFFLAANMLRSRVGRALISIRDNEVGAASAGVHVSASKTSAFAVSAAFAAVGGSMITLAVPIVTPDLGGFNTSVSILAALIIGGAATIWGPLIGAFLIIWLPVLATDLGPHLPLVNPRTEPLLATAFYGVLLIIVVLLLPGGVVQGLRGLSSKVIRIAPAPHQPSVTEQADGRHRGYQVSSHLKGS